MKRNEEAAVDKLEAQLRLWSSKIDDLVATTQLTGVPVRFETLICIDELKALHAIAQLRFDEFTAAKDPDRSRLKIRMKRAWNELDVAFQKQKPSP